MSVISFCMIVKDAEEDLKAILPVMAKISEDIVIVDTGSTDNTQKVAGSLGACVIPYIWQDSFADARNVYIDEAKGDWIISIDADERIEEKDLHHIKKASRKKPQGFLMTTRNYGNDPGVEGFRPCTGEYPSFEKDFSGWSPSTKVRMFPRIKGLYYQGEVRELIEPTLERLGIPTGEIVTPVHHFGAYPTEKRLYYRMLLEKKASSNPDDPRAAIELAVEDFHLGRFDLAIDEAKRAIDRYLSGKKGFYFDISSAYNLLGASYIKTGDNKKAMDVFDRGLKAGGKNKATLKKNKEILSRRLRQPTLGVVMIVKDEEKNLGNILGDVKDIADEIVVVDTGSQDKTVDIAKSYGAKMGFFKWCDDFSAARNRSIELADSDYLLWIDADDRILGEDRERLSAFKKTLRPEKDMAYLLKITNDSMDDTETISYQARIFPNRDDIRFEGRIHEQILPVLERKGIKIDTEDIVIRHTGYHSPEEILEKARRNLDILLDELRDGKDTPAQYFFIATSYFALHDYEKCLEYIVAARKKAKDESWYKYSYSLAADCYLKLKKTDDAIDELKRGTKRYKESGLMHYYLGITSIQGGRYNEAIKALEKTASLGIEIETYTIPSDIREMAPYYYGIALEKTGNIKDALSAYKTAFDINPDNLVAIGALGLALLRTGKINEAMPYLEKAKENATKYDPFLWLSLARVYCFTKKYKKAHELYLESKESIPENMEVLVGLIQTSIETDDVDTLIFALDRLMQSLGLDSNKELNSVKEIAGICVDIGQRLFNAKDSIDADKLADASLRLDSSCKEAYILKADVAIASKDLNKGANFLEKALINGASPMDIKERMKGLGSL